MPTTFDSYQPEFVRNAVARILRSWGLTNGEDWDFFEVSEAVSRLNGATVEARLQAFFGQAIPQSFGAMPTAERIERLYQQLRSKTWPAGLHQLVVASYTKELGRFDYEVNMPEAARFAFEAEGIFTLDDLLANEALLQSLMAAHRGSPANLVATLAASLDLRIEEVRALTTRINSMRTAGTDVLEVIATLQSRGATGIATRLEQLYYETT